MPYSVKKLGELLANDDAEAVLAVYLVRILSWICL